MKVVEEKSTQLRADGREEVADIFIDDLRALQAQLVLGVLRAVAIFGFLAAAVGTYESIQGGDLWTIPFYWGSYAVAVALLIWRDAPYNLRVWSIGLLLYVMAFVDLFQDGPSGSARAFLLVIPFVAGILLGRRASVLSLVLSALTLGGFGWAYSASLILAPDNPRALDAASWAAGTLTFVLLGTMIVVSLSFVLPRLAYALTQSRTLAQELDAQRGNLAHLVEARTVELARRSNQLEAAARIAREAASIRDLAQVLDETVSLISEYFGFYHTGVFLLDDTREFAILRAASSPGGQRMLERSHRLKVGEVGIVGYVANTGEPRIALDVGSDAGYFDNPDLPDTRSEMALPLRLRGDIIGVLDVQSAEPAAFGAEDATVLQILADQIAVAIGNARLFQRAQESVEAERRAYRQLGRETWKALLRDREKTAHRYDPQDLLPVDGEWRQEMKRAVMNGETVQDITGTGAVLGTPIKVRDQVIGVLSAYKPEGEMVWTQEEIALMESMVDQLGVALESARLYQETQRRAVREEMLGHVASRIRETLDIETVLKTAAQEVRQVLGLPEVVIRVGGQSIADGPDQGEQG